MGVAKRHSSTPPGPVADNSAPLLPQMDPKFLRNQRFSKKWMGKGRGSEEEE